MLAALEICQCENVRLTWYGLSDKEISYINTLISDKIKAKLFLCGWHSYTEMHKLIRDSAGIGLATYVRNYKTSVVTSPTKIFDYYSAGLPVIASRIRSVTDILTHGKEGLVYSPGNANELAECILELVNNKEMYVQMQKNSSKTAEYYSWNNRARRFMEFYRSISWPDQ
jgi:glycosyltransferase involved in cell wall biosynthesis